MSTTVSCRYNQGSCWPILGNRDPVGKGVRCFAILYRLTGRPQRRTCTVGFNWRLMGVMTGTLPPGRYLRAYGCYLHCSGVAGCRHLPEGYKDNHGVSNIRYKGSKASKNCKHGIFLTRMRLRGCRKSGR